MLFISSARYCSPQAEALKTSFAKFAPEHELHIYYNAIPSPEGRYDRGNAPVDLDNFPQTALLKEREAQARNTITDKENYRWKCVKFFYKILALNGAFLDYANATKLCWLDSDVELTTPLDDKFFNFVFPTPDVDFAYLGRKDWHHLEAGFMGFNNARGKADELISDVCAIYTSGDVFRLPEWHDSYVIDLVRDEHEKHHGLKTHNLSSGVSGVHVWPKTILGEYLVHHKGPERKAQRYGDMK